MLRRLNAMPSDDDGMIKRVFKRFLKKWTAMDKHS